MPDHRPNLATVCGMAALLAVCAAGCSQPQEGSAHLVVGNETGMVHMARSDAGALASSAALIAKAMTETFDLLDEHKPDSEIAKVNKVGASVQLPVSRSVLRAVELARLYHHLTDGVFDITTGELSSRWSSGALAEDEVADLLTRSGFEHMEISDNGAIAFTRSGMALTPGRYAFAYALDVAVVERRKTHATPCLVIWPDMARRDGTLPESETPLVRITAPGIAAHPNIGAFELREASSIAMVHQPGPESSQPVIIDPRTGFPATNNLVAAVCGPLAVKAYALARTLLILGPEEGGAVLAEFPGYEAMLMPDRKRTVLWMTPGFESDFTPDPFYRGKTESWVPATDEETR